MRTLTLLAPALTLGLTACFDLGKLLGGDSGDAGDTGAESLSDEDTDLDGWSPAEGTVTTTTPTSTPAPRRSETTTSTRTAMGSRRSRT